MELAIQLHGVSGTPLEIRDYIDGLIRDAFSPEMEDDLSVEITMHSGHCVREECGNDDAHLSHEEEPTHGAVT